MVDPIPDPVLDPIPITPEVIVNPNDNITIIPPEPTIIPQNESSLLVPDTNPKSEIFPVFIFIILFALIGFAIYLMRKNAKIVEEVRRMSIAFR